MTVTENLLSTTNYNGALSTTYTGAVETTLTAYFPYLTDLYHPTILIETTINTDSQQISISPTNSIQASKHVQSATASSVYRISTLKEAPESTVSSEVTTHYNYYTGTVTVASAIGVDQKLTTAQYRAITHSRPVDLVSFVNTIPLSTSMHALTVPDPTSTLSSATTILLSTLSSPTTTTTIIMPYPPVTQTPMFSYLKITSELQDKTIQAITEYQRITNNVLITTVETDPSPSITAKKKPQIVTLRETVAWALLSLMTLLFIGLLSVNVTALCIHKCRQKRNNMAQAYEMAGNPYYDSSKISNALETDIYESIEPGNPCYGSSKISNALETDIYESIEPERVYV